MQRDILISYIEILRNQLHSHMMANLKERNTTLEQFLKMYGESNSGVILYLIGQVRLLDMLINNIHGEEE